MTAAKLNITTRTAGVAVSEFLKTATPEQRASYLIRGEPECFSGSYMGKDGLEQRLYPALRGVIVGKEAKNAEDAIAEARQMHAHLSTLATEPVDEAALGIDDEAINLSYRFESAGARLETILHIGTMNDISPADTLAEAIEDIVLDIVEGRKARREEAPLLAVADHEAGAEQTSRIPQVAKDLPLFVHLADTLFPPEGEKPATRPHRSEIFDEFLAYAHDHGAMGFLVNVSVPQYSPHKDGRGASIHGGVRYHEWRYASTFQVAADRALEWAEDRIHQMWPGRNQPGN